MIEVQFKNGHILKLDKLDYEMLVSEGYRLRSNSTCAIAVRNEGGRLEEHRVHRLITGALPGEVVDHINGDPYDNRRKNLRKTSPAQNAWNRKAQQNALSKYKGVVQSSGRWVSKAVKGGVTYNLGTFDCQREAAIAYNGAACVLYGPFARLNDVGGFSHKNLRKEAS